MQRGRSIFCDFAVITGLLVLDMFSIQNIFSVPCPVSTKCGIIE